MRNIDFANGEYYHIFNRGVDKRNIFMEPSDTYRFFQCMDEFNTLDPIGSIYEQSYRRKKDQDSSKNSFGSSAPKDKLADFVCYCLNPNHYHFLLRQLADGGISKLMHRIGTGYTNYFNEKYNRSGSLFQGRFKAVEVDTNEYLLYVSAYVNLNNRVHAYDRKLSSKVESLSSWREYTGGAREGFCDKDIILSQFESNGGYINFAESALGYMRERKDMERIWLE